MNIDAYATYIGKPHGQVEHISSTVKRLALMNDLTHIDNGVYVIDHQSGEGIPFFNFPITTIGFNRKPITVMDDRPFINKNNVVTNPTERVAFQISAFIQQDAIQGNFGVLESCRSLTARAFVRAFGNRITQRAGLDTTETLVVLISLLNYYVCQTVDKTEDYAFITRNLAKSALQTESPEVSRIAEQMGYIKDIKGLFEYFINLPGLYKLKMIPFKDFLAIGQSLWYSVSGKHVMGVALELPSLLTGIVGACCANPNAYSKTNIGMQIDPRRIERDIDAFKRTIVNSYPIKL